MEPALTLKDAAALLGVSYSTIYELRFALGFFKVGNQWRVWPETLRHRLDGQSQGASEKLDKRSPDSPRNGTRSPSRRANLSDAERHAAAVRELDELLARKSPRRRK